MLIIFVSIFRFIIFDKLSIFLRNILGSVNEEYIFNEIIPYKEIGFTKGKFRLPFAKKIKRQ